MPANYDNAAWFYDKLSTLVYGRSLIEAQQYLLQYIPPNSRILIAGGGTGWILEAISDIHPSGLTITYVEVSSKMMALSKKRRIGHNQVTYIHQAVEELSSEHQYDVVITFFLFDNFTPATLHKLFDHIHRQLSPSGLWLNADFQIAGKWWHQLILNTMFIFFRLLCNIEAKRLPDIKQAFKKKGYKVLAYKEFFGRFMLSEVYQKIS